VIVLVSGMVAGDPHQGGATWSILQYLLGLRRLGHDAWLVEPVRGLDETSERYFGDVMARFGLADRAALLVSGSRGTAGVPYERLLEAARYADVVLNVSGMLRDENLLARAPVRVYLDLDPAFNQLWQAVEGIDMGFAGHTHFVTVGLGLVEPVRGLDETSRRSEWAFCRYWTPLCSIEP
jgi:hypothetical protein